MKAINLFSLTRIQNPEILSRLLQAQSLRPYYKSVSPHEAASLWSLTDALVSVFRGKELKGSNSKEKSREDWLSYLDGFYFSYTIEHIGKEFDLLKVSEDGECVLNIELKSEAVPQEQIKKQLSRNRYYLLHISRIIYSFTYVMETNTLYQMNEKGYLRVCELDELAEVLRRPTLSQFAEGGLDDYFKASDYLISPVATPEKFLQEQYFLTNQQAEFKRQILELLASADFGASPVSGGSPVPGRAPVISLAGIAGTGKTLLLFDLAMALSKKKKVLLLHAGPLRKGHLVIHERLHNVDLFSAENFILHSGGATESAQNNTHRQTDQHLSDYEYVLIDEANRLSCSILEALFQTARASSIPVILTYDPQRLLSGHLAFSDTEDLICSAASLQLEFTGNIRINRPAYSFLRTLFYQKDRSPYADYSCIDVLYASDRQEETLLVRHYLTMGYNLVPISRTRDTGSVIAQEYDRMLVILDENFYYDESLHLCVKKEEVLSLQILYEALSRTREKLCLLISHNPVLFEQILSCRIGKVIS